MGLLKKFIIAVFLASLLSTQSHACSWIPPEGMTSEWVEGKVIFWGRAITSIDDRKYEGISQLDSYDGYTDFEVLESLTGDLPKKIKVFHDSYSSSCGVRFEQDDVRIYVVSKANNAQHFVTSSYYKESISQTRLAAYYENNIDVPALEWGKSMTWPIGDYDPCKNAELRTDKEPYFCKWRDATEQAKQSYASKKDDLEFANRK